MSALAGIFKFDPKDRVNPKQLMELARGIDRIGPDGGAEYITHSLGMVYRAFHTTLEARFEVQPLVRRGCIFTWDGRLDNREEISTRVSRHGDETSTDIDLVFAAYETWGTHCFAELIGDWVLALWDQAKQQLMLARDYIGVRRLFYRLDESSVAWCTTIEPLVLTAPQKLHLDLDYIAGCLYPRPPVEATAYQEIRSVVPASFLAFKYGGKQSTAQYWTLNPHARIRYSTDLEYEAHFREVFRESVSQRLRADGTVLAELSGGLDSSSIVCTADDIQTRHPGVPVETLSYYDTDEPTGDERPYFTLVEEKRGRTGHHISISDFARETADETLAPLPDEYFSASPGYFLKSLRWASKIDEIQRRSGARVILSGLGGDEMLGGVQYEAPELAEHLLAGRPVSFLRSLYGWSLARKKTIFELLGDAFQLLRASHNPESLLRGSNRSLPWARLGPSTHHSALPTFTHWALLSPPQLSMEWIRYNLAQQLTCTDPSLVGCMEKRYPFLGRSLFVFLASIPRTQVLQAAHRRHLMRRALRDIIPDGVISRKTKWFGIRSALSVLCGQENAISGMFEDEWLSDTMAVDAALVREHLQAIQHGATSEGLSLYSAIGIEQWLRHQWRRGSIAMTSSCKSAGPVLRRTGPFS